MTILLNFIEIKWKASIFCDILFNNHADNHPILYFWHDVFTTNKRGRKKILNVGIIFHQIRKIDKSKYILMKIKEHEFKILNKKESKKWMKLRK